MVFGDIAYYDEKDYRTHKGYLQEIKRLNSDIKNYYKLVKVGGILAINDYINICNLRPAPRDVFNKFVILKNKKFIVYPSRGGLAVLQK